MSADVQEGKSRREVVRALGLMSGTSLDGVDAALLETDGKHVARPGPFLSRPYDRELRDGLRGAIALAAALGPRDPVPGAIREAEIHLTDAHAAVVEALLDEAGIRPQDVRVIGFHGQTILHRPDRRWTWQIGDGARLARLTGIPTISDPRQADIRAGGEGAPLAPLYHAALAAATLEEDAFPLAVLNIGGVANVTWIAARGAIDRIDETGEPLVVAFDTGPGNALIDDWVHARLGLLHDAGGGIAARGSVSPPALRHLMGSSYFRRSPPKSLDRNEFSSSLSILDGLSSADGAATLVAFTAAAVQVALAHFPKPPARWLVTGGGRHNAALMTALAARVGGPVAPAEAAGWRGDAIEAEAFAYLAVRALGALPLTIPTTTGVPRPVTGGRLDLPA